MVGVDGDRSRPSRSLGLDESLLPFVRDLETPFIEWPFAPFVVEVGERLGPVR